METQTTPTTTNEARRAREIYADATAYPRSKLPGYGKIVLAWVDGRYVATYEGAPYWSTVEIHDGFAVMQMASLEVRS
jgi:hypothetical protein